MNRFVVTDKERRSLDEWLEKHCKERHSGKHPYAGAIGGFLTYQFTPTSIGTALWVQCMCGERHDCTDYDLWG